MMPIDPILLKQLGDDHLSDLRADAARQRVAGQRSLPAWRRLAGQAMLSAGFRLLGERRTERVAAPAASTARNDA